MLTLEECKQWLDSLTIPQLRALACRWKVADWDTTSVVYLKQCLLKLPDVEIPIQTV